MDNKQFDLLVFIGRFQPYHNGHHYVVQEALKLANNVLILIGSANKIPDARNPFTFEERRRMIKESLPQDYESVSRVYISPINDYPYDEARWVSQVQSEIEKNSLGKPKIGLIGHAKDNSSYYLKMFPMYESVDVKGVDDAGCLLDATYIRKLFFNNPPSPAKWSIVKSIIPEGTKNLLDTIHNQQFENICNEIDYVEKYAEDWGTGPFVTVDAVIVQAGHVLLIERGDYPGKGQLALPGGFVEPRERLEDAVMRELKEETSIDIPPGVLKNRIVAMQHFSHPWRSNRAHIITFAFLFDLNSEIDRKAKTDGVYHPSHNEWKEALGMTKVKGGDDAAAAMWYPISQIKQEMLFEDHYDLMMIMLDKLAIEKL